MRTGRPKAKLTISNDERSDLLSITRSRSLPAALTLRAKIVLAAAEGSLNQDIAAQLGTSRKTVSLWRRRFVSVRRLRPKVRSRTICAKPRRPVEAAPDLYL
mgnify:CR=1 FL=1